MSETRETPHAEFSVVSFPKVSNNTSVDAGQLRVGLFSDGIICADRIPSTPVSNSCLVQGNRLTLYNIRGNPRSLYRREALWRILKIGNM